MLGSGIAVANDPTGVLSGEQSVQAYAIKAAVKDPDAPVFTFRAQKTMYGGKRVRPGDVIFIFASETDGGTGLIARGVVTAVRAIPRTAGVERETPRITLSIERTASATRPLGRAQLRHLTDWDDGDPGTELNFKFYRQATNKVVGLSEEAASYLTRFFTPSRRRASHARSSSR
jgi:hypothetical protein